MMTMTPERESIDEALGHILSALDIVAGLALKEETYDEVADEVLRLGMIISRAQLILSFIRAQEPPPEFISHGGAEAGIAILRSLRRRRAN